MYMNKRLLIFLTSLLFHVSCVNQDEPKVMLSNGKTIETEIVHNFFQNLMDTLEIPGLSLAFINDGRIVYHKTFGTKNVDSNERITKETYFEAASLSKPLFAYFVMKQVDKGLLNLDRPLYEYLEYADIEHDERYKKITTRMVLSHTSGLPNWRTDRLEIQFSPGTKYQYSGEGYRYLSNVIASVNDVSIEDLDSLFQKEIVHPISADHLYFKYDEEIAKNKATGHIEGKPTDNGAVREGMYFGAAGGLHTEAYNYAKFLTAIMNSKVLSPDSRVEILKAQIQLEDDHINKIIMNSTAWSLGFGIIPRETGIFHWHSGNNEDFQSWFHMDIEMKYGIVLLSNCDRIQNPEFFTRFFDFLDNEISFDMSNFGY